MKTSPFIAAQASVSSCLAQFKTFSAESLWFYADIDSFLIAPGSVNVTEGERVRLTCTTGYSAPPAAVHWERDGNRVSDPTEEVYFSSVRDGEQSEEIRVFSRVADHQDSH